MNRWFFWVEAEPIALWLITSLTSGMGPAHWLRLHLIENVAHTRLITLKMILLLTLRFTLRGLIPEFKDRHDAVFGAWRLTDNNYWNQDYLEFQLLFSE